MHPFHDPDALPRVVSRSDMIRRGIPASTVDARAARGRWTRLLPRTYLTAASCVDRDRLEAAVLYAGRGAALSGAAALVAAQVQRVAMPMNVLVLVPPANCAKSVDWVRIRRTVHPYSVALAPGPRRVEAARAAADLAVTMRRLDDVRSLVARVVQDRHCTVEELGRELRHGPRRGSKFLREALEEIGFGAESAPEAKALRILRDAGVAGFEANVVLDLPDGSQRRVDFYFARLRACLEIDSFEYHFEQADWSGTWDRHLDLSKFGYSVIHRPPSALRDPAAFVRDVRDWLAGREADLRRGLGA